MIKKGYFTKDAVLATTLEETIASYVVPDNVDQVLVSVSNGYVGAEAPSPTVAFTVYVQFGFEGSWWEISYFYKAHLVSSSPSSTLVAGQGFWGLIPDLGISAIKIVAKKTGVSPVPVGIEVKFLAAAARN